MSRARKAKTTSPSFSTDASRKGRAFDRRLWSPETYLREYYSTVEPDERATIRFLVERFATMPHIPRLLEFGSGPTLHHIFPAVPYCDEIHMADYLPENLAAVREWLLAGASAHAWDEFIEYTLQCEGNPAPTRQQLADRAARTRERVTKLLVGDAANPDPLGATTSESYPVVLSCYCADSATGDKEVWARYLQNIATLLAPGGTIILASLRNAEFYTVGPHRFPSAHVDEFDLRNVLAARFDPSSIEIQIAQVPEHAAQGYRGILLCTARKSR